MIDGLWAPVAVLVLLLPLQGASGIVEGDEHASFRATLFALREPLVGVDQLEVRAPVKVSVGLLLDLLAPPIGHPDVLLPVEVRILPMPC